MLWLALLSATRACAQSYTRVVVFGDSLSDTGNYAHLVQSQYGVRAPGPAYNYADGRVTDSILTTPPSAAYAGVWVEQLAARFSAMPPVLDSLDGGTNYAYGGATTAYGTRVSTFAAFPITVANMGQQVASYQALHPTADSSTLFILFGGTNDLLGSPTTSSAVTAASNEAALVQLLVASGATDFVVPNLPPFGDAPGFFGTGSSATINDACSVFRSQLATDLQAVINTAALGGVTLHIYQPDLYTAFTTQSATPAAYGLTSFNAAAQGLTLANADTYFFWDAIHPSTTGHHLIATAAESLLNPLTPSTASLTVTPATTVAGQTVTLSAAVTGTATGAGPASAPSGLVSFFSGSAPTLLGTAVLDATGTATFSFAGKSGASPASITAVYAGDLVYSNSTSAAQTLTVLSTPIPTSTTLTSSANPVASGTSIVLAATVTSSNGAPAGAVTFFDGTSSLATVALSGGTASLTAALTAGTHSITATFAAAGLYGTSTSPSLVEIVSAPSVVSPPSSGPDIALALSSFSLTVQHGSSGSVILTVTPIGNATGTVTFSCGTLPAHGSCSFTPSSITLAGSAANSTLTFGTTSTSGLLLPARPGSRFPGPLLFAAAMLPLCGLGLGTRQKVPRRFRRGLTLFALLLLTSLSLATTGCGNGAFAPSAAVAPTTTPGSYSIVVTATLTGSTPAVAESTLAVTVQ